jgi:GNAT superfamily N-acetyltransferase
MTSTTVTPTTVTPLRGQGTRRHSRTASSARRSTRPGEPETTRSPSGNYPPPASDTGLQGRVIVRDGLAVAGAWSLVENGDCGIYAVETTPRWRRRGLARTLRQSVLGDAYRHGARTATLQSTPMGEPLYISLGFEPVGRYAEWVPA